MFDLFANSRALTLVGVALIALQSLWWWRVLRRTKTDTGKASWVLYASQSGQAQALAEQTAKQLSNQTQTWQALNLADWQRDHDLATLNGQTALFVVSTQGEGDPPDNGVAFFRKLRAWDGDLSRLRFAVLGLGDSRYAHFCGFAHDLQQQLKQRQAKPLCAVVTVDNLNADDVDAWQSQLAKHFALAKQTVNATEQHVKPPNHTAKLSQRHCENPASPAAPLFSLQFEVTEALSWQGGDIAEVMIPTPHGERLRSYTLANIPDDSTDDSINGNTNDSTAKIQLLVRQVQKTDGALGIGSGYLTNTLNVGETLTFSIRRNPSFHLPESPTPLLFIATGSGLAGILALLQQADKDWGTAITHHLIYGERYPDRDTPCREVLTRYQASGLLRQVDYCFSRGEGNYRYVQDALTAQSDTIKTAIQRGAMVYVCGSKAALGESIPHTLKQCLGEADYQRFLDRGGLRLDVY